MKRNTLLNIIVMAIVSVSISAFMPTQKQSPTGATESNTKTQCPADTEKGKYFLRGYDKATGEAICGFTYYNACPYFEAAEAGTQECENAKPTPEQMKPWKPEEQSSKSTLNQCGEF